MQNSAYANYPTLTSQDESDVPSTNLDLQEQGSDILLISFRKCSTDPGDSTEEGPSTPSNAHSDPHSIHVYLENESN